MLEDALALSDQYLPWGECGGHQEDLRGQNNDQVGNQDRGGCEIPPGRPRENVWLGRIKQYGL